MKIGLVGYQGSGKSTLFQWLTGVAPDPALAHTGQSAMAADPRSAHRAALQDLSSQEGHAGGDRNGRYAGPEPHARGQRRPAGHDPRGRLPGVRRGRPSTAPIRWPTSARSTKTSCWPTWRSSPTASSASRSRSRSRCRGRSISSWSTSTRTLKIVLAAMESGKPLRESHMTDEQQKVTRAFRLLSEKPRLVIVNTADDEPQPERFTAASHARGAGDGRARRAGTGTGEDDARRTGRSSSRRWAWAAPTATI